MKHYQTHQSEKRRLVDQKLRGGGRRKNLKNGLRGQNGGGINFFSAQKILHKLKK